MARDYNVITDAPPPGCSSCIVHGRALRLVVRRPSLACCSVACHIKQGCERRQCQLMVWGHCGGAEEPAHTRASSIVTYRRHCTATPCAYCMVQIEAVPRACTTAVYAHLVIALSYVCIQRKSYLAGHVVHIPVLKQQISASVVDPDAQIRHSAQAEGAHTHRFLAPLGCLTRHNTRTRRQHQQKPDTLVMVCRKHAFQLRYRLTLFPHKPPRRLILPQVCTWSAPFPTTAIEPIAAMPPGRSQAACSLRHENASATLALQAIVWSSTQVVMA